ncbi:fluoride efflux transporter CrcB [Subtercola sp. YIM 133946]|uniref:fluoride efflux transporter CrcB n=1 Tax=Subtercola sp. YIM 133946 TaxID=3118909 RepID=UPI002F934D55
MSAWVVVAVAIGGGLGAMSRFVLDGVIRTYVRAGYPIGTTVINVTGSFLLGLVTALALGSVLTDDWRLVLGTGFLGGYTTFSTASFETVRLAQTRRYAAALANGLGMLVVSVAAAALGFWLGS